MLKKTITYKDYDDVEWTEDYYFNLNESELYALQESVPGGMQKMLSKIAATRDGKAIMDTIRTIIKLAYGEKTPDGKRFVKKVNGHELFEDFEQTMAFEKLYTELITDAEKAADFIIGIMPSDVQTELKAQNAKQQALASMA